MRKRIKDHDTLDPHSLKRDIKLQKKHRPSDNRKSIQLIAKLGTRVKNAKKSA